MTIPSQGLDESGGRSDFLIFGSPAFGEVVATLWSGWLGTGLGLCPASEAAFERLITLPLFPTMGKGDVADVIADVRKVIRCAHQ